MELNKKQKIILDLVLNGRNIFITGCAGSGKSYLTDHICEILKNKNIGLTAMTGCAALLVNGKTLHNFLGIGLAKGESMDILKKIKSKGRISTLKKLEVLIIDEVSMLSDILFDKIAEIFKIIHNSPKPFGNLQVILVGDMSQLKPIEGGYCFNAKYWEQCKFEINVLTENMRINDDIPFHDLLNNIRWGTVTPENISFIEKMKLNVFNGDVLPTKLFSKNKDVDFVNKIELDLLVATGKKTITYNLSGFNENKIPESITLCIGAQVMITRNIENGIVNGTRGIVTFVGKNFVTIQLLSGKLYNVNYYQVIEPHILTYMPLTLAWATSIHRIQGSTIDFLEIDLGDSVFACGQAYVALSRARTSKSIKITNFDKRSIMVDKSVIEFYAKELKDI
jgi:ATP-dependent DNA helicase PIF1